MTDTLYCPVEQARAMLTQAAGILAEVESALTTAPKPKARARLRRLLSGVLADVETVRLAIKE